MMTIKRIVCLANSRKLTGRCLAGKEVSGAKYSRWIRPVSARGYEGLSAYERQYFGQLEPGVLDLIDVPLLAHQPGGFQPEDWLLDPKSRWVKQGHLPWGDLHQFADPIEPLWIDGYKTQFGLNDRMPIEETGTVQSSLRLIRVQNIWLVTFSPREALGDRRRRVWGHFH